jgi:hypothetical protein
MLELAITGRKGMLDGVTGIRIPLELAMLELAMLELAMLELASTVWITFF